MKKRMKIKQQLLLVILFMNGACLHEDTIDTPVPGDSEFEVQFTVRFPAASSETRGLSSESEDEVKELKVLAFEPAGGAFKYMSYAKKVAGPGTGEETYIAKLRTGNCDLMVLANSNEYIAASFPSGIEKGTLRANIIKSLQMTLTGKWNTQSGSGYRPIPMWGIKEGVEVNKNTDFSGVNAFDVTRILAKINVIVDLEAGHEGAFELTSVRYHNRRTKGQLIPGEWNAGNTHVQNPSLVEGDAGVEAALLYDGEEIAGSKRCVNEIYVLEAPKGSRDIHPKYPCLVIGGKYNNTLGYYRIDFSNKTDYMPILRNHTYDVTITKVNGAGFTDPDDAYNSLPVNIEANIIDWNPKTTGDIYFDGQHYLSIEKGRYELPWKALGESTSENMIKIKTDYPDGWKYESTEYDSYGNDWLTFMGGNNGLPNEDSERWLKLEANVTKQIRTATVTISVGRIRGKIIVKQGPVPDLELIIRDKDGNMVNDGDRIVYRSDNWTNQACEYSLEWFPSTAAVEVTLVNPVSGYRIMKFTDEDNMLKSGNINDQTGERSFGFVIKPFDTSELKNSGAIDLSLKSAIQYSFRVGDGPNVVTKGFTVVNELLDVQATKLGPWCKQGGLYSFEVEYNTPWELFLDGERKIMDSRTLNDLPAEGGIEGQSGKRTIHLKLEVGKEYDGKEATFRFVKPGTGGSQTFDGVKVKSHYNHPNSYMIGTNTSFEFSIVKAYRMWEKHFGQSLSGDVSMEVIWIDRTDQDIYSSITLDKETPLEQSLIKVVTTGHGGNAVVALLQNNEIVWSWHIWVVDYFPEVNPSYYYNSGIFTTLMDRNLGAWYNSLGDIRTYGLYYQWGRKDPFPGPATLNNKGKLNGGGNVEIQYFNKEEYRVRPEPAPSTNNLLQSIRNPNLFYISASSPYDWYTNNPGNQNDALWYDHNQLKSDFDPCPDGWRTGGCIQIDTKFYYTWAFDPYGLTMDGSNNYGWNYNGYLNIGTYPTAGFLSGHDAGYARTQDECWLWYGNHSGRDIVEMDMSNLSLIDRTYIFDSHTSRRERIGTSRVDGVPVRCEKDEKSYWLNKR